MAWEWYEESLTLNSRLLNLIFFVSDRDTGVCNELEFGEIIDEILTTFNCKRIVLNSMYVTYQISRGKKRTESLYSYLIWNKCKDIRIEEIFNIGPEELKNIDHFMSLFKGRSDVCAKRWKSKPGYSPYCFNDFKPGICNKPKVKCTACKYSDFAPLDEARIGNHLLGKYVLGLYPMTPDDTCFLLAMDFDESTWDKDIKIVTKICDENNISVYVERSRSGNGCHLWFFFEEEIKASIARKFGTTILNLAMGKCGDIKFNSCDRLFPSQDFLQ